MSYDKSEVDALVSNLNNRIDASNVTLNTVNSAVEAHNISPDAHNTIFSTKAMKATVSELSDTVNDLTLRIENLENVSPLKGTLNYSLSGKANETDVAIAFNIEPIDENHPVTYEVYGDDNTLLLGLTFDAAAGTISGRPLIGGSASYTVLAKSGSYGVFITILQSFENADYIPVPGYESLNNLRTVLRSSDISSLSSQLGVPITIKMADDTKDSSRTLTYNGSTYTRAARRDIEDISGDVLFAWSSDSSTIYTSEIAIFGLDVTGIGEPIKNSSGDVIGTLVTTPSYMKDYRIMMTSYDTDIINYSNKPEGYVHNARMEFLDIVCERKYDDANISEYRPSDIRAYLTSNAADGFLRRLPIDIRRFIVPADIDCVRNSIQYPDLYTDKVFLPSAWELCGILKETSDGRPWIKEGTKSLYYPEHYDADDTRIRYDNGKAVDWWTRTWNTLEENAVDYVEPNGAIDYFIPDPDHSRGIAPAFVIA